MRFTVLTAVAVCHSMAMRPQMTRAGISSKIARVGEIVSKISSPSDSLVALNDASNMVNNILAQAGNATDHMSGDDAELLNSVISLVEKTIYSSMDGAHQADVNALAEAVRASEACNADIAARQAVSGDLGILHQHAQDKQTELDRLQGVVDEATEANNTKWAELDSHMQMISAAPACPNFPAVRTMPVLDVFFEKSEYSIWFAAQQAAYDTVREAFNDADAALNAAIHAYNIQKAIRDVQYCDWRSELAAACSAFDACVRHANSFYTNELVPRVTVDMNGRIEVKKAGDTLIHQISFLLGDAADQETPAIDTSRYEITFPLLPPKGLCDLSPLDADEWNPVVECDGGVTVAPPSPLDNTLLVPAFQRYPGYTGDLNVHGHMIVTSFGGEQTLSWHLSGLDPACTAGPTGANGCGIHIHSGTSCSSADAVGGHFFTTESDPWVPVVYESNSEGSVKVLTHFQSDDILGRAMVVHNQAGGRIACGIVSTVPSTLVVPEFQVYPGYIGDLNVQGYMTVESIGGAQALSWTLSGLDPSCTVGPTGANGCGIHIHSGTSCASADVVGGHFFTTESDPWVPVVYESSGDGSVKVQTEFTSGDILGRAMVVHNQAGGRIACGVVSAVPSTLAVSEFEVYPGYIGDLNVQGYMTVESNGGAQALSWTLSGLDPACTAGPTGANGCGIHIHSGTSCASADVVGGHFFTTESDPWVPVVYETSGDGSVKVQTEFTSGDILGRAMVVHNQAGGRIACGIVRPVPSTLVVPAFQVYPGYTGDLNVEGFMTVESNGGAQVLSWTLSGLDPACSAGPTGANGCGIHIHSGTSCASAGAVGGHFFTTESDPWVPVVYASNGDGSVKVQTEFTSGDILGRAMVVHNQAGGRIACGVVSAVPSRLTVPEFQVYPGYTGDLNVQGSMIVQSHGGAQTLSWNLSGLDPACTAGPTGANGCGIHIHSGTSCASADVVGGHFFTTESDPWVPVVYETSGEGSVKVQTEFTNGDVLGRAMVVHNQAGGRIACGIIGTGI